MKIYTLAELSRLSGLSKKEIRKHLIAQTLKNTQVTNGYLIEEDDFNFWLIDIPNIQSDELDSLFKDVDEQIEEDQGIEISISRKKRSNNWKNKKLNGIKFADFFCGAGGLSLGLVMAGYEPVLGVEVNPSTYETYKNNIGNRFKKIEQFPPLDITLENNKKTIINHLKNESVKLICGGFPCQGFSLSGSRVISDPRNTLYRDMLDIVSEVLPDYIIMENVVGITTIYGGKVLRKIIKDYQKIGYSISFRELNAADYEVAQSRKRIIFIGNRVGKNNIFPSKIIQSPDNYITCGDVIEKYKNLLENKEFSHIFSRHSKEMQERLAKVEIGKCLYSNYNDAWKKCAKDKPSCTIKGNHGATNIHYELPRVITPREMAALQSFPDDYLFYGTKQSQLVQIGNAVPPFVARAVGLALQAEIQRENL